MGKATDQSPEWFKLGSEVNNRLKDAALARGVASIDGRFTKVVDAAAAIGLQQHYILLNKILSKLAHPTSFLVLVDPEILEMHRESTFAHGCLFFVTAFEFLEKFQCLVF